MPVKRFKIERVPLTYHPTDHQPVFPSFPVLYLELIENKEKVYPTLKDKPHDPVFIPQVHPYVPLDENKEFFSNPEKDVRAKLNERMRNKSDHSRTDDRKSNKERMLETERDINRSKELSAARQSEQPVYQQSYDQTYQPPDQYVPQVPLPPDPPIPPMQDSSDPTEFSIRSMLGGTQPLPNSSPPSQVPQPPQNLPPTLSEINSQSNGPVKNMAYTNMEEESKRKRELLFRFDILKRSYKEAHIPEFTEYTDLVTMERVYEDTVRKVGLESKVEGYKKFLTMGFFGVEFLFTNFLKVDMSGFAKQQMSSMGTYERLLVELGEKAMIEKSKSQWPIEVRLLFTIVMNAVIFLLMKNVMSGGMNNMMGSVVGAAVSSIGGGGGGGGDMMSGIMNMMSGLGGSNSSASAASSAPPKPKQKMKGPSVSLDDMEKKLS